MARNPVAKLVMGFFFILDVFAIIFLFIDLARTLVNFLFALAFIRPLSIVFLIEFMIVLAMFFIAVKLGEWLWHEIEE
jgi:hypothetical protein